MIFPAIIGGFIGYGISHLRVKNEIHSSVAKANK